MTLRKARGEPPGAAGGETPEAERRRREETECLRRFLARSAHVQPPLCGELLRESGEAARRRASQSPPPAGKTRVRKEVPKSTHEALLGDRLREAELRRQIRIRLRAQELLEKSRPPFELRSGKEEEQPRLASRNRERRLGFLQENFSFSPRIRSSVPDFQGLHRALQREASRRQVREPTRSRPFRLRTSSRPCRHPQGPQQPPKTPLQRSRSWTCLSWLSPNTLPVHITDAARRRESAVRLSQDDERLREKEGVRWAELQRKKGRAVQKSLNCRARALDPHKSLEETSQERLERHRQDNQRKTKEYEKELEEMRRRVKNRPYLFEQVTKQRASQEALRLFRDTLQQFGLNEEFVRKKGEGQKEPPEPQRSNNPK